MPMLNCFHIHSRHVKHACDYLCSATKITSSLINRRLFRISPQLHKFKKLNAKATSSHRKFKYERNSGSHQRRHKEASSDFSCEYLYGRSVCKIAMEKTRRPIFRVLVNAGWQISEPDDIRVSNILKLASKRGIPIVYEQLSHLFEISQGRPHQGVCLEVGQLPLIPLSENLTTNLIAESTDSLPIWVLLYDITDPINVGTLLRTCNFLGINTVMMTRQCSPVTSVVAKTSSGASEITQLYSISNPLNTIQMLLNAGWDVISSDVMREEDVITDDFNSLPSRDETGIPERHHVPIVDVTQVQVTKSSLLILGSEGSGTPNEIKEVCSKVVTINGDMSASSVTCLNVSTAAAIILHHLTKNRH